MQLSYDKKAPGKFAAHAAELRLLRGVGPNHPSHRPPVPLNQHFFALLDQIKQP